MKLRLLYSLFFLALVFSACKKDKKEIEEFEETVDQPTEPDGTIEDVQVPDGFDFSVVTQVKLNMTYVDQSNNPTQEVKYSVLGNPKDGDPEELYNGSSGIDSQTKLMLNVPNHYRDLIIKTEWQGNVKYFEYPVEANINAEMVVNGFRNNAGDTRSDNCYPSITNSFLPDDTGFTISSDQIIQTIEIQYTDGTTETVTVNGTSYVY